MMDMATVGALLATTRRGAGLSQAELARRAGVSRSTVAALEGGHLGELGFTKVARLLAVVGLALRAGPSNAGRPTLEELQAEDAIETARSPEGPPARGRTREPTR